MTKKTKRAFAMLCAITMIFTVAATAFATDDPLQVINNLSAVSYTHLTLPTTP